MDPEIEIIDDSIVPTPNVEMDFDSFDVVEEDSEPTAAELRAQLEETRREMAELKKSSDLTAGMQQGFQTLAQQLQAQKGNDYSKLPGLPAEVKPQIQQYSLPNKEDFEKDFFTNPYDAMTRMLAPVVGNQQQTMNSQMAEMNKLISKNNAYMNESNKDILSKYADEVEVYASRLSGKDPYNEAVKYVRSNHFQDIMNDYTKSAEERAYEKAKAEFEASKATKVQSSPVGMSNLGNFTNPPPSKVKVTKAQMDKVKQTTAMKFGPDAGPEVEMQMYNYMKDNGLL